MPLRSESEVVEEPRVARGPDYGMARFPTQLAAGETESSAAEEWGVSSATRGIPLGTSLVKVVV